MFNRNKNNLDAVKARNRFALEGGDYRRKSKINLSVLKI